MSKIDENRARIGMALLQLVRETGAMPDVETVARRAGVGRRTVFRYFDGRAALELETAQRMRSWITEDLPLPQPVGDVGTRMNALLSHRARLYETVTPVRRFLDAARSRGNVALDEFIDGARRMLRANLMSMLADELRDRPEAADALDVATSWETWRALREGQNCSIKEAERRMGWLVRAIIAFGGD
ncbi:TetR/AcrR family transcriptional regulator [Rhizobium sp. A37_96]